MSLEFEIKSFLSELGVEEMGIAGPGRFDGPPSLDPCFVLKNAKSTITFALPNDVPAIYDFLSKKSAIPHNIDLFKTNQKAMHIGLKLAAYLQEKGYEAKLVATNMNYRPDPDLSQFFAQFSHRYAAYVSGIGAPGISGNIINQRYGAAMVLDTVVTSAELKSDPVKPVRKYIDGRCKKCGVCAATCPTSMFETDQEEYAFINGELFPRGKKRDIQLCGISCGGMHALSEDKTWSNWGKTWVDHWIGKKPDPQKENVLKTAAQLTATIGDTGVRINSITELLGEPYPEEVINDSEKFPDYDSLEGETESEKLKSFSKIHKEIVGTNVPYPLSFTCGHCSIVCGPDLQENIKRYDMLINSGIVAFGKDKELIITKDFEKARELRETYPYKVPTLVKLKDNIYNAKFAKKIIGKSSHTKKHIGPYMEKLEKAMEKMDKNK